MRFFIITAHALARCYSVSIYANARVWDCGIRIYTKALCALYKERFPIYVLHTTAIYFIIFGYDFIHGSFDIFSIATILSHIITEIDAIFYKSINRNYLSVITYSRDCYWYLYIG